ncbi:MAG: M56 family metallopeptidase [Rhodothermales bacterium]
MTALLHHPFVDLLGAILVHSLWQGALIAGILAIALRLLRRTSPQRRYLVCWVAFVALIVVPVLTSLPLSAGQPAGGQGGLRLVDTVNGGEVGATMPAVAAAQLADAGFDVALRPVLAALWLIGVLGMSIRLALGWNGVYRMRRLYSESLDAGLTAAVNRLMRSLGITRRVRIIATDRAGEPMLIGWLKPVILIPAALLAGMPPAHVEAILAHELAHIRRHDYLFAVLQSILEAVLFYHPAAWWISGRIREERERACDDLAVAAIASRSTYVRALAGLEERRVASLRLALPAGGGSLVARIQRLVEPPAPDRLRSTTGLALTAAMMVLCGALVAACSDKTLPGEPLVETLAALPDELGTMVRQADIEGTITYLHDRREAGDPEAYRLLVDAFAAAKDADLRQNMVFVFAHINTPAGDRELIRIAETDSDEQVQMNAIRAIGERIPLDMERVQYRRFSYQYDAYTVTMDYPEMPVEQIEAIQLELRRIAAGPNFNEIQRQSAIGALAYRNDEDALLRTILSSNAPERVKSAAIRGLAKPLDKPGLYVDLMQEFGSESRLLNRMDVASETPATQDGLATVLAYFSDASIPGQDLEGLFGQYFQYLPHLASPSDWPALRSRVLQERQQYASDTPQARVLDLALERRD